MSKRGMENQGGGDRYGQEDSRDTPDDKPKAATAAQMARRKILQSKGRASARPSRQASPAVAGQPAAAPANPFQSFQPPPSTNGFSFSMPGSTPAPSFGQGQTQQNGFGTPAPEQTNGNTPTFGGFGNTHNAQNGATTSFGSGFGSQSQPQQNGFNPSTTFSFGQTQPNGSATATPATSFNPSQETPKQNGFKPSTTFGGFGGQQQNGNTTTSSFTFGQTQPQEPKPAPPSTPSFGLFGSQPPPPVNGDSRPASSGLFGSTPVAASAPKAGESVFSGISASNGVKPGMFTAAKTNGEQTPKPANPFAGFSFGQTNKEKEAADVNASAPATFSFGQTKEKDAPKPAVGFGQQNGSESLFVEQQSLPNGTQTPKPFAGFGQQANGEQTPKPANAFSGFSFGQTPAAKPAEPEKETTNVFGMGQKNNAAEPAATPFKFSNSRDGPASRPAGHMFGRLEQEPFSTSPRKFGSAIIPEDDASMMSTDNTPQKQLEAPAAMGKSLFDREAPKPPPAFSFSAATSTEQSAPPSGKSLFDRLTPREPEAPATAVKPSAAPFGGFNASSFNAAPSAPRASTQQTTSAQTGTSASWTGTKQLNEALLAHLKTEDPAQDWSAICKYYLEQVVKMTGTTATNEPVSTPSALAPTPPTSQPSAPKAANNVFGGPSGGLNALHSRPTAPSGLANSIQAPETPAARPSNMFSQFSNKPPATAPVNRKRSADEVLEHPATEKRARPSETVQYPKLPETASKTAQLFAASTSRTEGGRFGPPKGAYDAVQKQKAARESGGGVGPPQFIPVSPAFVPSTSSMFGSQEKAAERVNGGTNGFMPSTEATWKPAEVTKAPSFGYGGEKAAETPKAPSFGFMAGTTSTEKTAETPMAPSFGFKALAPAAEKSAETPSFGFKPSTSAAAAPVSGGFKPTVAAPAGGSTNFLSAFGQKAASEEEKARKRRMDEDYDSDDEDKASWEAKDRAAQEAKRKAIEEAAKSGPVFAAAPTTGGFKPTFAAPAAGSTNFLSAFGQKAGAEEEKARKRRMDEDYDSDDEDKASWEAKDRAAQEAKRKAIEEAAKSGPVFSVPATAETSAKAAPFAFKAPGAEKTNGVAEVASASAGKSLFERLTPAEKPAEKAPSAFPTSSLFSSQTPAKPAQNAFGSKTTGTPFSGFSSGLSKASDSNGSKEVGNGDKTWKPSTPIKFGGAPTGHESTTPAAPPPQNPFAGLFGSTQTSKFGGGEAGKLAPPTVGFAFGAPNGASAEASRATTPGLATDGEASTNGDKAEEESGGPSDAQNDKQVDDMTRLLPEELATDDLIYEIPMAKASKLDEKKTDDGYVPGWIEKGKGPLYILKNKTTGKTRVLIKIPPLGRLAMNFAPLKVGVYEISGSGKVVRGVFMDHFDSNKEKAGKPSTWTIQVREKAVAEELAKILTREKMN